MLENLLYESFSVVDSLATNCQYINYIVAAQSYLYCLIKIVEGSLQQMVRIGNEIATAMELFALIWIFSIYGFDP